MTIDYLAQLAVDIVVNTRRAKSQLITFQKHMGSTSSALQKTAAGIGVVGLAASGVLLVRKAFIAVSEAIEMSVTAFAKFEKQLVDVSKISKVNDLNVLADIFMRLSENVRGSSFQDIAQTMGEVSRAGIQGAENLEKFTATALRFAAVAGDITPREAAKGLAILAANFGISADKVENLASGVDALSDKFVVTSGQILGTSQKLAGFAEATGMSVENLNALSAVLLSTGQQATVVRTSVSKLLVAMASDPLKVAASLRLTEDEFRNFSKLIQTDPTEALKVFIKQLDKLDPGAQTEALVNLGVSSARVRSVIEVLKLSLVKLEGAQKLSNDETAKGTALLKKHYKEAQTATARIQELKNKWELLKAQFIESDVVLNVLTGTLSTFSEALSRVGIKKLDFKLNIAPEDLKATEEEIKRLEKKYNELVIKQRGLLFAGPGPGNLLKQFNIEGQLNQLEAQYRALETLRKAQEKALKEQEQEKKPKQFTPADFSKLNAELRIRFPNFENLKGVDAELERANVKLREFSEWINAQGLNFGIMQDAMQKAVLAWEEAREAILANAEAERQAKQAKEDEQARMERMKGLEGLGGLTGPFNDLLKLIADFEANLKFSKNDPDIRQALINLFAAQFDKLGQNEQQPARFRGLTQAWKDAQLDANKRDPNLAVLKAQEELARQILETLKKGDLANIAKLEEIRKAAAQKLLLN